MTGLKLAMRAASADVGAAQSGSYFLSASFLAPEIPRGA